MFNLIEEKTNIINQKKGSKSQIQSSSIVQESIKRSVFGVFSLNYNRYNELGKKESHEIWKNYFKDSMILTDVERCLLYFNLPFDDIIREEIKPEKLFD